MRKKISTKGFSLIDVMVAMGLGSVAVVATIGIVSQAGRVRREENLLTSLLAIRTNIYHILQRFDDFQATLHYAANLNSPANFLCLKNGNCPIGQTGNDFALVYSTYNAHQPAGTAYYDPVNKNYIGFDPDGSPCGSSALGAAPNSTCPIRVDLHWVNKCAVVACNPAFIQITVTFKVYRPQGHTAAQRIIGTPYDFTLIKSVYPSPAGPSW